MKRTVSLILLAQLAVTSLAQESPHTVYKGYSNPKKTNIAVTDFEGRGLQEGETHTLTDAFRSYLVNTGVFRVMERGQMDEIMKEQGFQHSGACTDQACMVEMGQLLGVEHIIAGSIGKVGGTYSVNARLISVRTSEIVRTVSKFHKGEIDGSLTETLPRSHTRSPELTARLPGRMGRDRSGNGQPARIDRSEQCQRAFRADHLLLQSEGRSG